MNHSKIPKYLFILPFLWAPPIHAADPPLTPSVVIANDSGTIVVKDAIGNSINDFTISSGNNINIATGNVDADAEDEIVINNNGQILSYPVNENALPEFFVARSHGVFVYDGALFEDDYIFQTVASITQLSVAAADVNQDNVVDKIIVGDLNLQTEDKVTVYDLNTAENFTFSVFQTVLAEG